MKAHLLKSLKNPENLKYIAKDGNIEKAKEKVEKSVENIEKFINQFEELKQTIKQISQTLPTSIKLIELSPEEIYLVYIKEPSTQEQQKVLPLITTAMKKYEQINEYIKIEGAVSKD